MSAPRTRGESFANWAGAVLLVLALAGCLLLRPEPASLAAPLLGPWAGIVYGHRECTLASASPVLAWGLAVLLAGTLALRARSGAVRARSWLTLLLVVGAIPWLGMALLSVLNTTA